MPFIKDSESVPEIFSLAAKRKMAIGTAFLREHAPPRSNNTTARADIPKDVPTISRGYQLEMLQESLKGNIIVVIGTGCGKTHIAVLRIKIELDIAPAEKRVWFLAPTKELCKQQFGVLKSQIASVQIKMFTSDNNVANWTEKEHWDAALTNVNVVVSTYGVLQEALFNGVIDIGSLSLIVFDEAHVCVGNSPGSKIMRDYYRPRKEAKLDVPHILGLTASAVMSSKPKDLEKLERTMDSICKSPQVEKRELQMHSNRPDLTLIRFEGYGDRANTSNRTAAMKNLVAMHKDLDIFEDPEIIRLRSRNTEASVNKMERALENKRTFIQDQVKSFCRRSDEINRALGTWAADVYVSLVISNYIRATDSKERSLLEWEDSEKQYLANALRHVDISPQILSILSEQSISHKVRALLDFLLICDETTIGIIFVKERAMAYMLQRLLSDHPETQRRLSSEVIIGTSQRQRGKRDICDLPNGATALDRFRCGEINLLIATSVLEEGIDVPECQLVICFDEPMNLKSYIQCRGRARSQGSQWVMLHDRNSMSRVAEFEKWELQMEIRYGEEGRNSKRLEEDQLSEKEQCLSRKFEVPSTGAQLNMVNAKGRLQRFCSKLCSHSSVYMLPEYIIEERTKGMVVSDEQKLFDAKVILPPALKSSLRVGKSKISWRSPKNATKDAAYEAFLAIYHAGLVNDHLLPLSFKESSDYMEKGESIVEIHDQFNPWPIVARAWKDKERLQLRDVTLKDQSGITKCKFEMFVPANLSDMVPIPIYWNASIEWKIEIGSPINVEHSKLAADHTTDILLLAFGHRWEVKHMKHAILFNTKDMIIDRRQLPSTPRMFRRQRKDLNSHRKGLQDRVHLFPFHEWPRMDQAVKLCHSSYKECESLFENRHLMVPDYWSRRKDFLHPAVEESGPDSQKALEALPRSLHGLDIPLTNHFQFGRLIPSILHKLEVQLVVEELCATVLADVKVLNRELIRTAISTPMAREQDNYQKLEFLGDSVLKFIVSVFVMSKHAHWPEGYLSSKKDSIVSNSRLCKAALERGLDKFILTKVFSGKKWRPFYVDKLLEDQEEGTREISSKTVADVTESLIGAAWKTEGCSTSLAIVKQFLPEVDLPSLEVGRGRLYDLAPAAVPLPANFQHLEALAGYSFQNKSLLIEAMSHSSYSTAISSYERLEFLGDAILEIIIVNELQAYYDKLSHSLMHQYRAAVVNNDYLGFIALEWNIAQKCTNLKEDETSGDLEEVDSEFSLYLWQFMRHDINEFGKMHGEVMGRHASLRHDILHAIESGTEYPWGLLARMYANKFYSDIVESLLAAVWVDTGSLDACKLILSRMGILKYLHRIVRDGVHVLHPKDKLSKLAKGQTVRYEPEEQETDMGSNGWKCAVFVGENLIFEVDNGLSDDEARIRAAEGAVSVLRSANGRTGSPVVQSDEST